ncbi:MAG: phosphate ABC transporter permease PstA [Rhodospirillaceae bacterium]|jgi:phosphate transport system permease protein|nr:phosphate ABC transporter permease PstA [Rhodospirillaceae bacterium]MBT5374502.1 phosphate ABC transporter permease PstA [Rhodospirillaceae bacterium]MBT5659530.1 phosphate ABC transporter permease PstA [Rhodospirillaceae bacterium]MBT5751778.1 phosphate ABC transporter permease PstA [Rhodospirillaceae bacterium]
MTDSSKSKSMSHSDRIAASLKRRHAAETRFRLYGISAIAIALIFLVIMLGSIFIRGWGGFFETQIELTVDFSRQIIDPEGTNDPAVFARADFRKIVRNALKARFPDVTKRKDVKALKALISKAAGYELSHLIRDDPALIGTTQNIWLPSSDEVDNFMKGSVSRDLPESARRIKDIHVGWIEELEAEGALKSTLNLRFFTHGDSREPENAGIWGAIVGSTLTLFITLILSFPLGVMAAIYLEELSPKTRWTDFIEVNINNMAAVPSIIYGLLGLAVFLNFMHLPRSAPLVGGMVLALMTLPTIIIATRASLKAVPPSIREAARGLGASPIQVVLHHVLPLAMPGILTGTIIGMARALGESAPLLMIGMVAFIVDIPQSFTDPATALPVQVYLWADSPERAFVEKTAAATIVLVAFLVVMNAMAVYLRKRFERRW